MRTPLALRLTPATRAALVRRATAAGVDPDGPEFAVWVGDRLVDGLPAVVGDVLQLDDDPSDAPRPAELAAGRASDLPQDADGIVTPSARPRDDGASAPG